MLSVESKLQTVKHLPVIPTDVLQEYVFTFKVRGGCKYGDFDHVLVKYRLWSYDDPEEWEIIPVSRGHCYTPVGKYTFDDNLASMTNLGTQPIKRGVFGGYKSADIDRLSTMVDLSLGNPIQVNFSFRNSPDVDTQVITVRIHS